jgi:uncharacterized membrane protein
MEGPIQRLLFSSLVQTQMRQTTPDQRGSAWHETPAGWLGALACIIIGSVALGFYVQTNLESELLAIRYISAPAWQSLVEALGGRIVLAGPDTVVAVIPSASIYVPLIGLSVACWLGGGWVISGRTNSPFASVAVRWGIRGWRWWFLAIVWSGAFLAGGAGLTLFLALSSPLWLALILNLWAAEWFALRRESLGGVCPADRACSARACWIGSLAAVAVYIVVFTAMNWGLWFNLQIPHGDSAMYEEHLWNVLPGKGFRSYLDQGLFLGEHIQVIHLFLIPLYVLWPSHLLLELAESAAIAATALPLYCITLRHTGSPRAALYLAIASLLYFPLQSLDIAIDFKTFRPSAFAIPVLLAAIDQMERGRWKSMIALLMISLTAQEDFTIPISVLGLWLAFAAPRLSGPPTLTPSHPHTRSRWLGAAICLLSAAYLFLAVKVLIPWFRSGDTVHYARYFTKFGEGPVQIVKTMITQPGLLFGELFDAPTFLYAAYLLVPLGLLPIISPGRLAVGAPLFVLLCLNELAQDPPGPFHHFHAPLLPILFWSAAAGLGRVSRWEQPAGVGADEASSTTGRPWNLSVCGARFALGCSLLTGVCYTLSPLGTRFWDTGRVVAGRPTYWRTLYLPDERAERWKQIAPLIPDDARVASTDFVHPRLTHKERSYDYSRYLRRQAGYEDRVPEDTDYIVLDLQHAYSRSVLGAVRGPEDVRELKEHPEEWELLTSPDDRFFIVLRRR